MVDLVKIRKKAKKKEEAAETQPPAENVGAAGASPAETAAQPAAPAPQKPAGEAPAAPTAAPAAATKLEKFKEAAGKRREAETVRVAVEETTNAEELELLTFVIAKEHYAVDIERIVEIVTPRPVTRIPNADSSVVGIISLRGTIVTLVDVRRKLRHGVAAQQTDDTRIIVIDFHGETVGFLVDRVLRVVKIGRRDVEPHPVVHASELDESIRGVFRVSNALTILLDLDKLLDSRALAATVA